jgi:hypothetical protein
MNPGKASREERERTEATVHIITPDGEIEARRPDDERDGNRLTYNDAKARSRDGTIYPSLAQARTALKANPEATPRSTFDPTRKARDMATKAIMQAEVVHRAATDATTALTYFDTETAFSETRELADPSQARTTLQTAARHIATALTALDT